tara:strand:+ start:253 stop:534 length:282 start_codon:yes stop_codon:yes gene_type:complete
MKSHIIIDIALILLASFIAMKCLNKVYSKKEGFLDTSQIIKNCNRVKRKGRARIYNIKNKVERNIRDKIRDSYNVSRTVMKKILFPKEIKITF